MKKLLFAVITISAAAALAGPSVTLGTPTVAEDGTLTVPYTLVDGPAVVTFDAFVGGTSVGGREITGGNPAEGGVAGDVFRKVVGNGAHSFTWKPGRTSGRLRLAKPEMTLKVTAWPTNDAPAYMTVDLAAAIDADERIRYYPSEDFLPGGGAMSNLAYRTEVALLKRISARGKTWDRLGNATYSMMHDHDYYLGVFELTHSQWCAVYGIGRAGVGWGSNFEKVRPMEKISYNRIRESATDAVTDESHMYPAAPHPDSFLGKLRTLTMGNQFADGLDFDLPSAADWEFAAWGGRVKGYWGDGSPKTSDTPAGMPGREYTSKTTTGFPLASSANDNTSAVCGCYPISDYGLYDMHGNVWEWSLDWKAPITAELGPRANANGAKLLTDETATPTMRLFRGGGFNSHGTWGYMTNLGTNDHALPSSELAAVGMRLWCSAGLASGLPVGDDEAKPVTAEVVIAASDWEVGHATAEVTPNLETRSTAFATGVANFLRTLGNGLLLLIR